MSRKRERRGCQRFKESWPPVFELPYAVRTEGEMEALLRQAKEKGFEVVGFVVCDDPKCPGCQVQESV